MIEHEFGYVFVGRDGGLYLATFEYNADETWVVSEQRMSFAETVYDGFGFVVER